jgi:hypothetical protein
MYAKSTGKQFNSRRCWIILRDTPKWQQKLRNDAIKEKTKEKAKEKATALVLADYGSDEEDEEDDTRHLIRKKHKPFDKGDKLEKLTAKNVETLISLHKEKLQMAKLALEREILEKNLSEVKNRDYRAYLEEEQKEILARWKAAKELKQQQENQTTDAADESQ